MVEPKRWPASGASMGNRCVSRGACVRWRCDERQKGMHVSRGTRMRQQGGVVRSCGSRAGTKQGHACVRWWRSDNWAWVAACAVAEGGARHLVVGCMPGGGMAISLSGGREAILQCSIRVAVLRHVGGKRVVRQERDVGRKAKGKGCVSEREEQGTGPIYRGEGDELLKYPSNERTH